MYKYFSAPSYEGNSEAIQEGVLLNENIGLRYIPHILTPEQCRHIISIAEGNFTQSGTINGTEDGHKSKDRTSYTYFLNKSHDSVISSIEQKVALMTGKDVECIEALQVVRYLPGQLYKQHHDWFEEEYREKIKNQRQYTFFIYLNDVEEGGETEFPLLDIKVNPREGAGVFWVNCKSFDKCYDLSLHRGNPPKSGVKYGLNVWIRF